MLLKIIFLLLFFVFFWVSLSHLPYGLESFNLIFFSSILFFWAQKRSGKEGLERYIFSFLALYVIVKYWSWRLTETITFYSIPDFISCLVLLLAELYSLLMLILSIFSCIQPINRSLTLKLEEENNLPTVDVFIPTYNEPFDIIKATVLGALNIIYPKNKIKVHLLDDGATLEKRNSKDLTERTKALLRYKELKTFCETIGARYLTREKNIYAKAGNLNEAFKKSSGDLIAVFDCDHVPAKDFLLHTVPYFMKDPKLFVVQTPHFFINPDPVEKNLRVFYAAPSENEMFYREIQPGLDFWNSSFFCGSAALLSRSALEKAGGFLGKTVTEDAETSINLHALGFNSAYVSRPLICGLTPETFLSFVKQRIRWAQGMIQIFLFYNPLFKKGLKWYQKLCYYNCILFWFFGFARLVFLLAPLFFIFFNFHIYNASLKQILLITLPYVITVLSVDHFLFGKVRWPFFSEIYETITSIFILPALIKTFLSPEKPRFIVTPKKEELYKDALSPLSKPFYILFFLLFMAVLWGIKRYIYDIPHRGTLLVTITWSLFNCLILFWILGALYERRQLRKFHRAKAFGKISIQIGEHTVPGTLKDLSLSGVGFLLSKGNLQIKPGDILKILAKDRFNEHFCFKVIVKRIEEKEEALLIGVEFLDIENLNVFKKIVSFVYGDSERWVRFLEEKEKPLSFLKVFIFLTRYASLWSIKGIYEFWKEILSSLKRVLGQTCKFLRNPRPTLC